MPAFRPSTAVDRIARSSRRPGSFVAPDAISLAAGEPDFATPGPIVEAAIEALRAGWTHYGDFTGDPELRATIAERVGRLRVTRCSAEEVVVTHGAMAGLASVVLATVDRGDRVVIPEPAYSLYADLVQLAGGTPVPVPTRKDHHLDIDALAPALSGARLIVFCNPCNPTGAVFSRAELEALAALLSGTDSLVVADEAYDTLVYPGVEFASSLTIPGFAERLIYVQTLSKAFAMTGWRLGYVVAPRKLLDAVARIHRTLNGPVNAAVQRAALCALQDDGTLVRPMVAAYARRRALLLRLLAGAPGLELRAPEGTFYAFVKYRHPMPSAELVRHLSAAGVLVRAGSEFGSSGEGHIRLSFAGDEAAIEEAVRRLRAVTDRLHREVQGAGLPFRAA